MSFLRKNNSAETTRCGGESEASKSNCWTPPTICFEDNINALQLARVKVVNDIDNADKLIAQLIALRNNSLASLCDVPDICEIKPKQGK